MTAEERKIVEDLEKRVHELEERAAQSDFTDKQLRQEIALLRRDFDSGINQLKSCFNDHSTEDKEAFGTLRQELREDNKEFIQENRKLTWFTIMVLASLAGLRILPELLQYFN